MTEMDALSEFCAGLSWADVERERLAPLDRARRESFGGRAHKAMLVTHELNRAKALRGGVVSDPAQQEGAAVLEAAEYVRGKRQRAEARRRREMARAKARAARSVPQFTRAQIDAALAAMDKQGSRRS